MRVLLVGLLFAATAKGEEGAESRYLRAWYTLHVEMQPATAQAAFQSLLEKGRLSEGRRAMCRLGVVLCKSKLGKRDEAIQLLRKLREDTIGQPELHKRVLAAIARLGAGRHDGTFKFHYEQGYSFKQDKVVDATEADVVFSNCAGGISSVTLQAPGGILNLERLFRRRSTGLLAPTLLDAIASADPRRLELRKRADGDSRAPESDVFVLRTRDGGWAKLCIEHRGHERGWRQHLVTIRYSYNPDRPVFSQHPAVRTVGGIAFMREPKSDALEDEMRRTRQQAERQAALEVARKRSIGGGVIPDPAKTQEVLLSRRKFRNYEQSTFSFRHGVRDDPDRKLTHNNWDLLFGNGPVFDTLDVRMVSDDKSIIMDLGESTWAALGKRKRVEHGFGTQVTADHKHIYFLRTEDTEGLYFSFVRVAAIRPGFACLIEWVSLQNRVLKTSPGLELTPDARAALKRLLAAHQQRADK